MQNDTENQENTQEENGSNTEIMFKSGSTIISNSQETFYCISIIGQVEGHYILNNNQKATKYDHLIPLLVSLEESEDISGILVMLNTMGGDVEAGLAISELIASMSKPTVSVVLGGGHSIGVPLAVSAKRSFIVPSATMTIHPVRTSGLVIGVPQAFDYLKRMQDRIISFITSHSNVNEDYLRRLMSDTSQLANDVGSVIDGNEAVKCGLIDSVGGLSDALEALRAMTKAEKQN